MVRSILILTLSILRLKGDVKSSSPSSALLAEMRRLRPPRDYFAETRTSMALRPEKILCFIRRTRREVASDSLERHHHHRYVLVIPWRVNGEIHVDDRRFMLRHTQSLLIFPFQFHYGFNFDQSDILWQFVTFEVRDGAALEALRLDPLRQMKPEDLALLSDFVRAWNDSARQDELVDWLALFLKRMLRRPTGSRKGPRAEMNMSSSLLLKINQHCLLHLHELFGLKKLAADLSVSESHLRASFRRETGMSLGQHLRRLRLQKAMGLLLQSDLSVTQVAERCGFDSIFTFSRTFRRFTGLTARDYRLQLSDRGETAPKNRKG